MDIFQFGLAVVGNDIPVAAIDESKDRAAWMRVFANRDVHVGDVGIEGGGNSSALEIESRAVNLGCFSGPLCQQSFNSANGVDGLAEPRLGLDRCTPGLFVLQHGLLK